jgi:competence protein ComFB
MAVLKNIMEAAVIRKYDEMIKEMDCCKCDMCRLDVLAFALNELPHKYVVTDKGELFAKASDLSHQFDANIITALTKAFNLVKDKPRH